MTVMLEVDTSIMEAFLKKFEGHDPPGAIQIGARPREGATGEDRRHGWEAWDVRSKND